MSQLPKDTALILVDVQEAFNDPRWGHRNNPDAEKNIVALLAAWRKTQRPVLHVQHRSRKPLSLFNPDNPGFKLSHKFRESGGMSSVRSLTLLATKYSVKVTGLKLQSSVSLRT